MISGAGFGCAPMEAQHWWTKTSSVDKTCGGATKTNGTFCGGPGAVCGTPFPARRRTTAK
jgi:hypothetical protein